MHNIFFLKLLLIFKLNNLFISQGKKRTRTSSNKSSSSNTSSELYANQSKRTPIKNNDRKITQSLLKYGTSIDKFNYILCTKCKRLSLLTCMPRTTNNYTCKRCNMR